MKRMMTAVAAAAVSLTLLAPGSAHAAVGKSDLLSPAQVKKALGGSPKLSTTKGNTLAKYKGCKQSGTYKGKSGLVGTYLPTNKAHAFTGGVVQMKSTSSAKAAVAGLSRLGSKCKKLTVSGVTFKVSKISAPKVGNQRTAYRSVISGLKSDTYVIRKKSKVVVVSIAWKGAPKSGAAASLVKAAVKKA